MRLGLVFMVLMLVAHGCGKPASDQGITELDTVEVGAAPDSGLSTEFDEQARQVVSESAGVLPTDIPLDVPIHSPSSLVDFGEASEQRRYVAVDTSANVSRVRGQVISKLASAGWELSNEADPRLEFNKAGNSLIVVVEDLEPGTRLRYEYSPRQ